MSVQKEALHAAETQLTTAEISLRRSQERFAHLVEGVQDYAIFLLDAEGHVIAGLSVTVDAMRMDMSAFRDQALPRLMQITSQVQDLAIKSGLST